MRLREIAHSRTGDKGDISNISVIAYDPADYELLVREVTVERVGACLGGTVQGEIGTVGEKVLEPGPTLSDGCDDSLGTGAVGDVCGGEIHHQQPAIGVDCDMPFAANDFLARIEAALFRRGRLD